MLEVVANASPEPRKLAEVAEATGLHRATAHRLLNALAAEGLVEATEQGYLVGSTCWLLGAAAQRRFDISEMVRPSLQRIARATDDVAFFSVRIGMQTRCIERAEGDHPILPTLIRPGTVRPLGVGSHGVAQLAALPDEEIARILPANVAERVGPYASYSDDYLRAKVEETRRQGFARADGEVLAGWGAIALVIRNRWGAPIGAMSYVAIAERLTPERCDTALTLLREERVRIEAMLGRASPGKDP